jgi:zinc protease
MKTLILALPLVTAVASAQEVAYEKFVLDNGLTVILHQDHALPQVVVNLWYRVGAKDERPGRSGFAHLFEHLMFLGTERAPGSAFDDIMEAGGGFNNASTGFDRTNYYDIGPAELLDTLLWLEADRMEALGPSTTQAKLDGEREVVRNERRQSYEDVPYGSAELGTYGLLYPVGHPYHEPVIGSHADLAAATLDDVKGFFAEFYVPNNASLVVAGDFDPRAVRAEVERLFGSILRGADPQHAPSGAAVFEGNTVHTLTDPRAPFAQTNLLWHSPGLFEAGDAELDLAAAVLAGGVSSRLYRALVVEHELAEEVDAYQSSRQLGSHFVISTMARPGVELADLEAAIDQVLAEFLGKGPTADELERAKAGFESATLRGLQSLQTKADRLNLYEYHFGEPDSFGVDLDRYRRATVEGVLAAARRTFGAGRIAQRVLPAVPVPADNPRDVRPQAGPPAAFTPEAPQTFELSSGLRVLYWQRTELPLVEIGVLLPAGSSRDPEGKEGLVDLVGTMMTRGAGERDAAAFADALERLGAGLSVSVDHESTSLRLTALARHFDASLDLLADALLRPRFAPEEWSRVHRERLAGLQLAAEDAGAIARRIAMASFFGPGHAYGRPTGGTLESVGALDLNDLVPFYADVFRPEGVVLLVAGDVERAKLAAGLERAFGGWKGLLSSSGRHEPPVIEAPVVERPGGGGLRVLLHDRPGSTQTIVRFQMPAVAEADPARLADDLVVTVLGGTFTSRLMRNLRTERGITYGAQANFVRGPSAGYLLATSAVQVDHTGEGVMAFLDEFARLAAGDLSDEESRKARASARLEIIQGFAGLAGLVNTGVRLTRLGRGALDLARELTAMEDLDTAALNAAASGVVHLDQAVLVLVGDGARILPQLEGLDLPAPVRVDAAGRPIEGQ